MSSPFPTIALCLSYIYFVKILGPKMMKDRPPFELKSAIIVYNVVQVVFSAWLVFRVSFYMHKSFDFCCITTLLYLGNVTLLAYGSVQLFLPTHRRVRRP